MAVTVCPSCGTYKGLIKLSKIVKDQEDPELIRRIAPPMDPQKAVKSLSSRDMLVVVALAVIMTTFFLALQSRSTIGIIVFGTFMVFLVIGLVRMLLHQSNTRKVAAALAEPWREASLIWNRLYYCREEDLVFDPRTSAHAKPEAMRESLLHYTPDVIKK